ncbi:hypothetical protein [Aureispira anguillae]|uniref:Uncharacterized protein n=1 Tax=Aureispira anguillae TaxID=2864201 RepID=A0A916DU81_9BACT|nr:hypothetical protein [Aureispira anguillae]BDS12462.1 hypothetical protein AsAng_0031850 [Aureispira anguillae]
MLTSKLVEVYKTLNRIEVRRFKKWLKSPAHNQHDKVIKLFDFIDSRYTLSEKTLSKKRAFKYLSLGTVYKEDSLNHIMSYAYQSLIEFLGYNRLIQEKNKINYWQLKELRERQLPNLAQQLLRSTSSDLEKQALRNETYYLEVYNLEAERMHLKTLSNRNAPNNLPAIFESLSSFFMMATLRYACIAISHTQVHKTNYSIPFLEQILDYVTNAKETVPAVLYIYYCAYMALKYPQKTTYFTQLKTVFFKSAGYMDKKEQRDVLLMTINYCIRSLNQQRNEQAAAEALELYQYGLEHQILMEHGILSKFAFNNIVSLGLKQKHFVWVEQFIQTHGVSLDRSYQKSHVHYNTAKLFFAQQRYDEVLALLVCMEYDDILMNIDAKVMLIKIYYQYQYFDALDALLNSFTVFLQRKSMLSYHRDNYIYFIQFTKRLFYLANYDKKGKIQLKKAIESTNPLTERQWLLRQLDGV